jgi:hypothetical protein
VFLKTSRYANQKTVEAADGRGGTVRAITLRVLPLEKGQDTIVTSNSRLDIIAQLKYKDPRRFWHIADANTQLFANDLVREPGQVIQVPER